MGGCRGLPCSLAQVADQAKTNIQRRIIGFGVAGLGASVFDGRGQDAPDEFWEAYSAATSGEGGDAYLAAVKLMAELAK